MPGILYIVATPIGNMDDITLRAIRTLQEADLIACEDTRQTRKLLNHLGIDKPTVSYHEHNEAQRAGELAAKLRGGSSIALVSDAGTPLVSDPGYRLVAAALDAGANVVPIPGASAALSALAASGLATDSFRFCGFLPPKSVARRKVLEALKDESCTLIFYEAPHRVIETLRDIAELAPDRRVVVARELTKLHEEFLRGTAAGVGRELESRPSVKGEITLLVERSTSVKCSTEDTSESLEQAVRALELRGVARMDAIKQVAHDRGLSKRDVYRRVNTGEQEAQ
jgi:16S rRNA (cytidine1402-2'-O)-methyltransferase